jgi:hypothetical protein
MFQILVTLLLSATNTLASSDRPVFYTELLDYVQEAPDQGETNTCLYVASTGAMELLANKAMGIKNPQAYGPNDLSESFVINAPDTIKKSFFETPVLRFNHGFGVHVSQWPYEAWKKNEINKSVWWNHPKASQVPKINLPKIETKKLFQFGNRWATNVLDDSHVEQIKQALWIHQSPIIVNYNDEGFWHVILIVGYDDRLPGECYDTDPKECEGDIGSFYIRDSFGIKTELRDYDWFRVKGNAAAVVKLAP